MFDLLEDAAKVGITGGRGRALLVEGWRGVNHSFALANQHQILELLKFGAVQLFHRDLPFAFGHWNRTANSPGFSAEEMQQIDALQDPDGQRVDCVYRIAAPFRAGVASDERKTVTFMITELGLSRDSFQAGAERSGFFTRGENSIVTSTAWSRDRILEWGFAPEKVTVIPLGVDTAVFSPIDGDERAANRLALDIRDDEFVFVNIGIAAWNKGIDLLLLAFGRLRSQGRRVRLILKDQRDVYGVSVESALRAAGAAYPALFREDTLSAISVIPQNMSRAQLRLLYGIADCYVSPYRAEGFNLPVLEALACGLPVIVTEGGATDDFCTDDVAVRIPGRKMRHDNPETGCIGAFVEPDLDALTVAMDRFVGGQHLDLRRATAARVALLKRFSWRNSAIQLARLTVGYDHAEAADDDAVAEEPWIDRARVVVSQREVVEVLDLVRPWSMACAGKVRIGNRHDGGYVVPETAFTCDAVLSIGVGLDVSFDLELAETGADVLQFDHTVDGSPAQHERFAFHKLGWGVRSEGSFLSFADIVAKLSATGARHPLLKFDIEGGEYDVLAAIDAQDLAQFEVIVCEVHDLGKLGNPDFHRAVRRSFEKLTCHHMPVHLHANNYRGIATVAGVPVPEVLEISFLRRDLDTFPERSREPIPGPLDRPNHPYKPDIWLTVF